MRRQLQGVHDRLRDVVGGERRLDLRVHRVRPRPVPADPAPEDVATLAERVRLLVGAVPEAVTAVLVWERSGPGDPRMLEADWIAALAATDAPIRAQLIAADTGAAVVDPAFAAVVAS